MNGAAGFPCEPWAIDSGTALALGALVLLQAEAVENVASRMVEVADLEWESPAGRNYRDYVLIQAGGVRLCGALLRDAAIGIESFAATLRRFEYNRFLVQQLP